MNFANQVKNTLLQDIANMANVSWLFSKHPETDFTRKRKIDFQSLLHFSICMEAGTLRHELLKYFSYDSSTLSNSAFYQQRRKLLPETFPFLFQQFNSHFPFPLYKGKYRLLACDGSAFTFTRNPQDPETYFPPDGKTTNGYNQVHLVALFDLLSRRFTDCTVQPIRKKNEFLALTQMIDRCDPPDAVPIFIADRGFHSFNVFAHAIEHNAYFLIRAKDVNMRRLLGHDIPEENCFDVWIDRILTRSQSKKKRKHPESEEQYRFICREVTFDYIDHGSGDEYPLSLRILRFKISDDIYENIITNLPDVSFSTARYRKPDRAEYTAYQAWPEVCPQA